MLKLSTFWAGLDWDGWTYGLIKGFIAGGATSVYAAFGALVVDPRDFAFGSAKSFQLIGWVFLFSALMQTFAFLSKTPLPDKITSREQTSLRSVDARGGTVSVDKTVERTSPAPTPVPKSPGNKGTGTRGWGSCY